MILYLRELKKRKEKINLNCKWISYVNLLRPPHRCFVDSPSFYVWFLAYIVIMIIHWNPLFGEERNTCVTQVMKFNNEIFLVLSVFKCNIFIVESECAVLCSSKVGDLENRFANLYEKQKKKKIRNIIHIIWIVIIINIFMVHQPYTYLYLLICCASNKRFKCRKKTNFHFHTTVRQLFPYYNSLRVHFHYQSF